MTEAEQVKVLNALYGYKKFKPLVGSLGGGGVLISVDNGEVATMSEAELRLGVDLAERVHDYFDTQDETKGEFVRLYFFDRVGWLRLTHLLPISRSTVFNWRREVVNIAERIARKISFI